MQTRIKDDELRRMISQKIMQLINLQLNVKPQMWWAQVTAWADDFKAWRLMHCNLQTNAVLSMHRIPCFPIYGILYTKKYFHILWNCSNIAGFRKLLEVLFPPIVPLEVVFKTKPTLSTYEDNEVCQVSIIISVFESLAIKYTRFPQEEMYIPLSFNNSCNLYLQSSCWKVWGKRVSIKAIKI